MAEMQHGLQGQDNGVYVSWSKSLPPNMLAYSPHVLENHCGLLMM